MSYTVAASEPGWLVDVSAFSGESLGELPDADFDGEFVKSLFQHSLVNLWVSYPTSPQRRQRPLQVSAFSGESLGELHIVAFAPDDANDRFSILW